MERKAFRPFYVFTILSVLLSQFGSTPLAPVAAAPAFEATPFTVNSTVDAVDANIGDGLCETTTPGECTLRAAVQESNALEGVNTITVPAESYTLSIVGVGENAAATGDLNVSGSLAITGASASTTIIDANSLDRAFHVLPGATLDLSNMTIWNGLRNTGGELPYWSKVRPRSTI